MSTPLVLANLRCEYLTTPMVVDEPHPRFSWEVVGDGFDRRQSAFRIAVRDAQGNVVWDSGKLASAETLGHDYAGAPLRPLTRYTWRVEAWDEADRQSEPAESFFETGLLGRPWPAPWICVTPSKGAKPPEATLKYRNPFRALNVSQFRTTLALPGGVKSARLHATALGVFEFRINGSRVGTDYLTPSFTDYRTRVEYSAYDVTDLLRQGDNAIGALLGEGWYSGYLGLDAKQPAAIWGRKPQLSAFLSVTLETGETLRLETDGSWRHAIGGLIYSDMLKGEKFDSRMHPDGWDMTGFDDSAWTYAGTDKGATGAVTAPLAPPVRRMQEIVPKSVKKTLDGSYVFDIGQNMVGICRARFRAKPDQVIRVVHAEMLKDDGTLYLENLRTANQEDIYIASRDGEVVYEPTFTFHGFQYVAIHGLDYEPDASAITGLVLYNDLPETGRFETSSPLLNQLQSNIVWGQRGNFISVPTDCPQRDERLGWTADGQVFAPTAAYNMDISAFFAKWMVDIVDSQTLEGAFGDVAPRVTQTADGAPAWGDVGVILPVLLYERYGDRRQLERSYGPMQRWMELIRRNNPDYLRTNRNHNNYGDWLSIGQQTPNDMVATAYWAWLAKLMAKAATVLNIREDAAFYDALFECIRERYQAEYIDADGRIGSSSQTSYLISLFAGLVPPELTAQAVGHLTDNIHQAGDKVAIGFLGVRHICPVLAEHGHADLAYKLAMSTEFPSWGYSIVNGATTIWERWDGWTRDKGFQVPNMNSFNHYAYGSIGEFLFEWMAGIVPDASTTGFSHFTLRPTPGGDLTHCQAKHISARGEIVSGWERQGTDVLYRFTIPANTTARIELPTTGTISVNGAARTAEAVENLYGGQRSVFNLGSGQYEVRA